MYFIPFFQVRTLSILLFVKKIPVYFKDKKHWKNKISMKNEIFTPTKKKSFWILGMLRVGGKKVLQQKSYGTYFYRCRTKSLREKVYFYFYPFLQLFTIFSNSPFLPFQQTRLMCIMELFSCNMALVSTDTIVQHSNARKTDF